MEPTPNYQNGCVRQLDVSEWGSGGLNAIRGGLTQLSGRRKLGRGHARGSFSMVGNPGDKTLFDSAPQDSAPYRGPERRKGNERRQGHDRREMIRFELDKNDRRSGKDRRKRTGWDTVR